MYFLQRTQYRQLLLKCETRNTYFVDSSFTSHRTDIHEMLPTNEWNTNLRSAFSWRHKPQRYIWYSANVSQWGFRSFRIYKRRWGVLHTSTELLDCLWGIPVCVVNTFTYHVPASGIFNANSVHYITVGNCRADKGNLVSLLIPLQSIACWSDLLCFCAIVSLHT